MSKTKSSIEGFAIICEEARLVYVAPSLEIASKAVLMWELSNIADSLAGVLDEIIENTDCENPPDRVPLSFCRTRRLARDLEKTIQKRLYAQFSGFLLNERGFFSSLYHPKGEDSLGLVIVKAKLDLATGRVITVQFYDSINRVWGDAQKPTAEIRDQFEGPNAPCLQEIRKELLAERANKRQ